MLIIPVNATLVGKKEWKGNWHLSKAYYVPGTLYMLSHLIFTPKSLQDGYN